jgi:acetolactate synthase-1/3 small subunit
VLLTSMRLDTTEVHTSCTQDGESYDVYVNQPTPLNEGEEKRIISVFVADESGMINRVAGVFARRSE